MIKQINKLLSFAIFYIFVFWLIRFFNLVPREFETNITSTPGIFSVVGVLFSILSAFVINTEWGLWNRLVDAIQTETHSLRQLHLLSHHMPGKFQMPVEEGIKKYLKLMAGKGWKENDEGTTTREIEETLWGLEEVIYSVLDFRGVRKAGEIAYDLLNKVMQSRQERLNYGQRHLPSMLKIILGVTMSLIVILSLVIRITNFDFDLLFACGIAVTSYAVFVLIDDLAHPFKPGAWSLSTKEYKTLLDEMASHPKDIK